jgi:hypothetical protein
MIEKIQKELLIGMINTLNDLVKISGCKLTEEQNKKINEISSNLISF